MMSPSMTTVATASRPTYPVGVPIKFSADGAVQRYPGNTTVCHIPAGSPLLPGLHRVHDTLGSHPTLSRMIRLVPQESWHMTVLDGVRETECEPGMWPQGLEKEPLEACTKEFSRSLRQLGPELEKEGLAPPYRMRVRGFDPAVVGVGLEVEGATSEEQQRMRKLRDRLADTLGFRAPNHLTYQFHVTIAYWLRHVDGEDRTELNKVFTDLLPAVDMEFELGAVEFCTFENMCAYPRLFYLGDARE
ncbi:RNA ligase/cyclic nucleotide phosphodiesterase [Ilyonectria sp. MPI-CAGE-AT-0026]|nr:RNA ligase/cyclic nucleotide phosphodiesterase [Ilyonectria sp. MPI-CAGE-AT-0026]